MSDSSNWLIHDHRNYEAALKACEIAAGVEEWKEAVQRFDDFVADIKMHMRMEDEVLYPFFKEEVGDPNDEIGELIDEHEKLAQLLRDLAVVIKNKNYDHFEECLEPLYKTLMEHNAHEEAVFSRMSDHALLTRREEILRRLEALHEAPRRRKWDF